ncbi:type I-F CRISPR-associated endoribonuclease Cas6/Csy4 [Rhodocyclus tenuis]|uniref:CRISPR-associated endoribonuclease Cas6/Csy4 subtype I-F n=1 Tax=Rhodocyclus tenuis TaxID=1066 RepID=A0A840FXP6_RHOTE|nr:type I-F CRISPR-associated endoribonuclease Cas6/Csy4 [Rhodocyclus tenuis]MBB4246574.1 CRISPR-associated endoribonuclease Cas6/Csy4 subtype I-F [Rhodocyclus tenuis]
MMEPRHYVDFQLGPRPSPITAALALKVLHGVFGLYTGQYALALPDYPRSFPRLRVFAASREALDRLVTATETHPGFAEGPARIGRFAYPKAVPEDFNGPWVSYRRYRIPSRKAERKPEGSLRLRRIQAADEAELPFFALRSQSNGQAWRLYVEAQPASDAGPGEPDAYGLATASRPFALPRLP